jgi:hypothetical protein
MRVLSDTLGKGCCSYFLAKGGSVKLPETDVRCGSIATESGLSDRFRSTPGNGHRRTASACRKSARRVGFVMVAVMSDPPSTDISGAGLEYLNLPGTDILRMGILAIVALLPPRPNPILRSSIPASAGTNVYCGLVSVSSTEKS